MSISAFYDVGEYLYQNRKDASNRSRILLDRKSTGNPVGMNVSTRSRNSSSTSSSSGSGPKPSPPSPSQSISLNDNSVQLNNVVQDRLTTIAGQSARKLDRTVSEPGHSNNNNNSPNSPTTQSQSQRNANNSVNINSARYKTEMCRPFEENGHCKYGDKCQFAHGMHELRGLSRHPKYKTELCRTFHTVGFCPYGARCHFIHSEDERKLNQINHINKSENSPQQQQQQQQQNNNNQQQPQNNQQHSQQVLVPRPKTLYPLNLPLGSTADSPASSVTDSPTLSPTFLGEDVVMLPPHLVESINSMVPASAPCVSRSFTFPDMAQLSSMNVNSIPTLLAPLNVQTDPHLASLHAVAETLNQRNNNMSAPTDNIYEIFGAPPSPPDSISGESSPASTPATCGSPMEVSQGLRLPIFRKLSIGD